MQVAVSSPFNSYPSLQLRDRTVPDETGNRLSAFMLLQAVFRLVQSEISKLSLVVFKSVSRQLIVQQHYYTADFVTQLSRNYNLCGYAHIMHYLLHILNLEEDTWVLSRK